MLRTSSLSMSFVEVMFQLDHHITPVHLLSVFCSVFTILIRAGEGDSDVEREIHTILPNGLLERIQHPLIPRRLESDFSQVEGVCT
jgi:hypothetical protein